MTSLLTRRLFRCLIQDELIIHSGCLRRRHMHVLTTRRSLPQSKSFERKEALVASTKRERRTIFNFSLFPKRQDVESEARFDPGVEKMMEFSKRERMRARLPSVDVMTEALKAYFIHKRKDKSRTIPDTQAQLVLQSLRYVMGSEQKESQTADTDTSPIKPPFAHSKIAAEVLRRAPKNPSHQHVELARMLVEASSRMAHSTRAAATRALVSALCYTGSPYEARDVLVESLQFAAGDSSETPLASTEEAGDEPNESGVEAIGVDSSPYMTKVIAQRTWHEVMNAFVEADNEEETLRTLDMITDSLGDPARRAAVRLVVQYYAKHNNVEQMKRWVEEWRQTSIEWNERIPYEGDARVIRSILAWCLKNDQRDYGHSIVRHVMTANPPKLIWDEILVWALGLNKSVEEIRRMLDVMVKSNYNMPDGSEKRLPDIATINRLIEAAIAAVDPYMAERLISLGRERGFDPDATTFVLQINYRLSVGDVDGALAAYKNLQAQETSSADDVLAINHLIVAMASSKRHDFDTIMNIAADLSDRRVAFELSTVTSLTLLHLKRGEIYDVIDLLGTYAHNFTSAERTSLRKAIIDFCLDGDNPTSTAWDTYGMLRNTFDETPREERTTLMQGFFKRARPDMAINIFNHMRTHSREDIIPTIDTYVAAFLGCASCRDLESLESVHNQLKLDPSIDVDTYLRNALMIGYWKCGGATRALRFWDEIVSSTEGPTYNTLHITLRVCEDAPFGDIRAQEIWARLRRNNVEVDRALWASYIAALAGNGDNGLAIPTLDDAEEKAEVEVDSFIVGSLYNAAVGEMKQDEVEGWAKEKHAHLWDELEKVGWERGKYGNKLFRIDRSVSP